MYKVGDKIRVKVSLSIYTNRSFITENMLQYRGRDAVITAVDKDMVYLDICSHAWRENMLELVEDIEVDRVSTINKYTKKIEKSQTQYTETINTKESIKAEDVKIFSLKAISEFLFTGEHRMKNFFIKYEDEDYFEVRDDSNIILGNFTNFGLAYDYCSFKQEKFDKAANYESKR